MQQKQRPMHIQPEKIEYFTFCEMLEKHKWSVQANSWSDFFEATKEEAKLLSIARSNGVDHTKAYVDALKSASRSLNDKVLEEQKKSARELYNRDVPTGDSEFDEFRMLVRYHDWYYSYSDDIEVWRRGEARWKEINETANAKGGIYKTYLEHATKLFMKS